MSKLKDHFENIRGKANLMCIFNECHFISNGKYSLEADEFVAMADFEITVNKARDSILAELEKVEKVFERKLNG